MTDEELDLTFTVKKNQFLRHERQKPKKERNQKTERQKHDKFVLLMKAEASSSSSSPLSRRQTASRRRWWEPTPGLWWAGCEWWCCLSRYEEVFWSRPGPPAPRPNWQQNAHRHKQATPDTKNAKKIKPVSCLVRVRFRKPKKSIILFYLFGVFFIFYIYFIYVDLFFLKTFLWSCLWTQLTKLCLKLLFLFVL